MIETLLSVFRGPGADVAKAKRVLRAQAAAEFSEAMADYDAFVEVLEAVAGRALRIGTTRDSLGREIGVRLPVEEFAAHGVIQGSTGSGKTSFATWLFASALQAGLPVGLLDCKAGFFEHGLRWAAATALRLPPTERPRFVSRLAVVNPFGDTLVPLNVCRLAPGATPETQAYDVSLILNRLFDSAAGFQMQTLMQHLLLLLMEAELTLVEAPIVLQDPVIRGILVDRSTNPQVREYFSRYESVPASSREAVITRLQALLMPHNLRLMLGADDVIDFKAIFDRGDPLFLFLGMGAGIPAELVDLVGTIVLQLLFDGAKAGSLRNRQPYVLFSDEFFHLIDTPVLARRFERGLDTLRGFGVHLAMVLHRLSQVPRTLQDAILQHCDLVALFRTSARDAQSFAEFLPEADPELVRESLRRHGRPPAKHEVRVQLMERIQRLPNRTMFWYDRRRPYRALPVRVPDLPSPEAYAGVSVRELDAFMESAGVTVGALAKPKAVLAREIEARQARLRALLRPAVIITETPPVLPVAAPNGDHKKRKRPRLG